MPQIEQLLQSLAVSDTKLRQRCIAAGLPVKNNDHISACADYISEIEDETGIYAGTYVFVSNGERLVIPDIPFKPAEISILCASLENAILTSVSAYNACERIYCVFENNSCSATVDDCAISLSEDQSTGLWMITLSYEDYNQTSATPKLFQAGFEYRYISLGENINVYSGC